MLSTSYFTSDGAACAKFLAKKYVAPLNACVRLFLPPGAVPKVVKNSHGALQVERPQVNCVDARFVMAGPNIDEFTPRKNALKQIAVIEAVRLGDIKVSELNANLGNVSSAIKTLEAAGVVKTELRRRFRGVLPGAAGATIVPSTVELTPGQANALAQIEAACAKQNGSVVLVDGVTGSGKTEVYLRAIASTIQSGKTAIVLVPEISLTPQTVSRFRARFGNSVAVLHSRMSAGERFDQWDFIKSGQARVCVGARSALFAPMQNLGLIVIDEEHETTYKQEQAPRYVSRDVACWMAERMHAAVVLGSATPSIEAQYQANKNPKWTSVSLPARANGRPMPEIEVVDMALAFANGQRSMFSYRLQKSIIDELSQNHKVVLLLNQRGFAKFLLCRDCGFVPECRSCSTSLTYHERGNKLVCHHCGYTVVAPAQCPKCQSPYLKRFGAGTQRVESELRALLDAHFSAQATQLQNLGQVTPSPPLSNAECVTSVPIIRMDADTTSAKGAHERLLTEFAQAPRAVLLGTQMIAKGLDFEDVTLVGVVNADTQLHLPDFRAQERTFDLVQQVAGRAGRGKLAGRVLVQTYEAQSPAIKAAAAYNRDAFLREELTKRKILKYPPYVQMANIIVWGKIESQVKAAAQDMYGLIRKTLGEQHQESWEVLSPCACVLAKERDFFRWHIVIKAPLGSNMSEVLERVQRARKVDPYINVALDIDPASLL